MSILVVGLRSSIRRRVVNEMSCGDNGRSGYE
jgi:hypothetical protein